MLAQNPLVAGLRDGIQIQCPDSRPVFFPWSSSWLEGAVLAEDGTWAPLRRMHQVKVPGKDELERGEGPGPCSGKGFSGEGDGTRSPDTACEELCGAGLLCAEGLRKTFPKLLPGRREKHSVVFEKP